MESSTNYFWSIIISFIYLALLMRQGRYRLILPSVIHTTIWLITSFLVFCQLNGFLVSHTLSNDAVSLVSRFTLYLVIASVIGFSLAHYISEKEEIYIIDKGSKIELQEVEDLLVRFRWVPYMCGIVGMVLFIFLITTIGDVSAFGDYRIAALQTERVGYAAIAQRISGHINILGGFYLMLLGYKSGQVGIKMKELLLYFFLCSTINMSIGGRVWLMSSSLPFLTTYLSSRHLGTQGKRRVQKDGRQLVIFLVTVVSLFSIIGLLRGNADESRFIDKFLYLTDGTRMTNLVMTRFPEYTYSYEYGKSTLLNGIMDSPMVESFKKSISDNVGLSVTVKSIMPNLYYDFGIWGGVFWGIVCFFIELICIRLKQATSIIGLLLFGVLSILLFQTPVGNVFAVYTPTFEWLILLYLFRKRIFKIT